jgi:hypothetical protein
MEWKKGENKVTSWMFVLCVPNLISLVKYSVLKASFKKVKIWIIVWLWSKHKLCVASNFSFVTHGWCDHRSSIYCTIHWKVTCYDSIVDEPLHDKRVNFWQNFDLQYIYICNTFLFSLKKYPNFGGNVLGKKFTTLGHKFLLLGNFFSISTLFYKLFANWHKILLQMLCQKKEVGKTKTNAQ